MNQFSTKINKFTKYSYFKCNEETCVQVINMLIQTNTSLLSLFVKENMKHGYVS